VGGFRWQHQKVYGSENCSIVGASVPMLVLLSNQIRVLKNFDSWKESTNHRKGYTNAENENNGDRNKPHGPPMSSKREVAGESRGVLMTTDGHGDKSPNHQTVLPTHFGVSAVFRFEESEIDVYATHALTDDASIAPHNTYLDYFALAVQSSVKEGRLGFRSALYDRACPVVELLRLVDRGNAKYLRLVRELHEEGHVASHLGL